MWTVIKHAAKQSLLETQEIRDWSASTWRVYTVFALSSTLSTSEFLQWVARCTTIGFGLHHNINKK